MRSITSNWTLDPPPHTCFNCRKNCKDGKGHKVLECPEANLLHCENCGRRGVHVLECPRCSEAYVRDGYYLENDWAAEYRPIMPTPGASRRVVPENARPRPAPAAQAPPRADLVPLVGETTRRSVGTSPPPPPPPSPSNPVVSARCLGYEDPSEDESEIAGPVDRPCSPLRRPARPESRREWIDWAEPQNAVPAQPAPLELQYPAVPQPFVVGPGYEWMMAAAIPPPPPVAEPGQVPLIAPPIVPLMPRP